MEVEGLAVCVREAHEMVCRARALDRERSLDEQSRVPLLRARVVVRRVARAKVRDGHLSTVAEDQPTLRSVEPALDVDLREGAADRAHAVRVP